MFFCDNEVIVKNSSKKKHLAVNCHRNREALGTGAIIIACKHSATDLAGVLTKIMPSVKRNGLLDRFMY